MLPTSIELNLATLLNIFYSFQNMSEELANYSPFLYSQSQHGQFRLAQIRPASAESILKIELSVFSLENPPPYEIISYGLDDPSQTSLILCNEQTISITRHLFRALLAIRSELRAKETRFFWVDAICINHSDTQERSMQIPLQASITSRSSRCTIWVGDQDGRNSDLAFALLSEIGTARRRIFQDEGKTFSLSASHHFQTRGQLLKAYRGLLASQDPLSWEALDEILERPPFRR